MLAIEPCRERQRFLGESDQFVVVAEVGSHTHGLVERGQQLRAALRKATTVVKQHRLHDTVRFIAMSEIQQRFAQIQCGFVADLG